MTEVSLTLALNLAGLGAGAAMLRWMARHDAGSPDVRRVVSAVRRAARVFAWAELRALGLLLLGVSTLVFAGVSYLGAPPGPLGAVECALGATLMIVTGALAASSVALWSMQASLSSSARLTQASEVSLDRALNVALRSGGAQGLLAETVSFALVGGACLVLFSLQGGWGAPPEQTAPLVLQLAALMPSTALGASLAALVLQRGGAVFQSASDLGAGAALELDPSVGQDDPRNPAIVGELVGHHVGRAASRSVDLFLSSTIANVVIFVVAASAFAALPDRAVLCAALVPVLVRAFGVIASVFGLMVVRTEETSKLEASLVRGHVTALVIAVSGLASASFWLLEPMSGSLFLAAGALGLVAALGGVHLGSLSERRGLRRARRLSERLRVSGGTAFSLCVGGGLHRSLLPSALYGLGLVAGFALGEKSGLPHGGLLATLTALASLLATTSYVTALASLGPIARTARGLLKVGRVGRDDALRRIGYLQAGGEALAGAAQSYLLLTGFLAALAAAAVASILVRLGPAAAAEHATTLVAYPIVLLSAAVGALTVLTYAGGAAQAAAQGGHDVACEVERQLRGFGREGGRTRVPLDHTPNYRACIELCARHGLGRLIGPVGAGFFFPLLFGGGLGIVYRSMSAAELSSALVAFGAAAALTGLGAALTADSIHVGLDALRGSPAVEGEASGPVEATGPSAAGGVFGTALGPAAQLLAKTAALAALAIAPFLK